MKKIIYKIVVLSASFAGGILITKSSVHWPLNGLSISPYISWCYSPSGIPFAFIGVLKRNLAPGQPITGCATDGGYLLTVAYWLDIIFWAALIYLAIWSFIKVVKKINEK